MKAKLPLWLWLVAVAALAINLRAPLVAVSPVVNLIQQDLQVSGAFMGLLAALPIFCFAFFSPFVARLARRIGMERALLLSILVLAIGIVIRSSAPTISALLIGTLILSAAISIGNVLLPALAKRSVPHRVGLMIGVYTISMSVSATIGAAIAVPVAHWQNWQWSLGVWLLTVILAFVIWFYINRHSPRQSTNAQTNHSGSVWRLPAAWLISLFFGLQSLVFYATMNFMPSALLEKGVSQFAAGNYGSLFQLTGLLSTILISWAFGRSRRKPQLTAFFSLLFLIGVTGLWLGSADLVWLWVSLAGIGTSVFSIALMILPMRTSSTEQATQLSGMAQTVGYGIAALGPLGVGIISDVMGSWSEAMSVLAFLLVVQTILSWLVAKPKPI